MLVKNSAYRVANVFIVLLTTIVLSRLAGAAGYGLLALFTANVAVFNLFTSFGTESGMLYHSAAGKMSRVRLLRLLHLLVVLQLAILLMAEYIYQSVYGHHWLLNSGGSYTLLLILFYVLSFSLSEKYAALLNGSGRYTLFSRLQLGTNLVTFTCFLILYLFFPERPVLFYVACYVVLAFIQSLIYITGYYSSNAKYNKEEGHTKYKAWRFFFSYSLLTFFTNAIQFVAYRIDLWFIEYYYSDREMLGWYGLAVRLVQLFWVLPLVVAGILYPLIAAAKKQPDTGYLLFVIRSLFAFQLLVAAISYALVPWAISFLFGKEFAASAAPFCLLLPGVLLFGIATILAAYFSGTGRLGINFFASLLCLLTIVVADRLLVPSLGMRGAAIAGTIGYTATTVFFLVVFCVTHKIKLSAVLLLQPGDAGRIKRSVVQLFKK
ncbi:MAG TPA: polysaccharide biosynthesis C-terminal domain-containing protein [Chitinophagaceae bacterium]|nr:polysaccharide biosynthesis C-terminal domain-containing protein [Chitinophagaceae bacterium]